MIKCFSVALVAICSIFSSFASESISGSWRGELKMGPNSIPLIFHFKPDSGKISCTMDSPLQNAVGLPMNVDFISSDSIAVSYKTLDMTFTGSVSDDNKIEGFLIQRGFKLPLSLKREEPLSIRRPQTPKPPFPYTEIDTVFKAADGTLLAGTITIPDKFKGKKMKMVVMVTGSGPQNRDEEFFEHRPFAVIADYLARNGIASFRYDDRGTAKSKGDFANSTTMIFKDDALAALEFVRSLPNVGKAGILGHSEGGSIAFILAENGKPDFIISLAGMVIKGKETILDQNRHLLELYGFDEKSVEDNMKLIENVFDEIEKQTEQNRHDPIDVYAMARKLNVNASPMVLQSIKANIDKRNDTFDTLLTLDAGKDLAKVKCPVLAINGTLDTQVDVTKNLTLIRDRVKGAKVYELEGLNHLLQPASSGEISEYPNIRITISPEVLTIITDFLTNLK